MSNYENLSIQAIRTLYERELRTYESQTVVCYIQVDLGKKLKVNKTCSFTLISNRNNASKLIRQSIPRSSSWHNLLSESFRKNLIQREANLDEHICQVRKLRQAKKLKIHRFKTLKFRTRKQELFKSNKCNTRRPRTLDGCFFISEG